jgi:protein-L-isoaspartate(D-aspartate) O-methyltransferase
MQVADQRDFYARLITGRAGVSDNVLIEAFATVAREAFVGPGPWQVFAFANGYVDTPTNELAYLYQDVLVALASDRRINNGEPSLHVRCLAALAPRQGEEVLHVGSGTGYYTAILARLVGPKGSVTAYEIERDLAQLARANLATLENVSVRNRSGTDDDLPPCDAIYVNAGATHPLSTWLDALRVGGRLLFPLTPDEGMGSMLLVSRTSSSTYAARHIWQAMFIPCFGARNSVAAARLAAALARRDVHTIASLVRNDAPNETCWCAGDGWWISTAPP